MTRALIYLLGASLSACATQTDEAPSGPPAMEAPDVERSFGGEVLQRLRAGSYTYLQVRTSAGAERWVVTLGDGAPEGSQVQVRAFGVRHDFKSRRLARTFDHLVFGIVQNKS